MYVCGLDLIIQYSFMYIRKCLRYDIVRIQEIYYVLIDHPDFLPLGIAFLSFKFLKKLEKNFKISKFFV